MSGAGGWRLGSVCSGYEGLGMAIASVLDVDLTWVADPDPGAAAILAHHWPAVPNLGDITVVDWTTVPPVDVVCGGYPCQPFSLAGHRKGTADDRHIWPYIAAALRVLRPRYAIFENVASHLRLGFADVLTDLADLGFDAEWLTLRASDVGGAHQRNRLFVLARSADTPGAGLQGPRLRGRAPGSGGAAADADRLGDQWHGAAGLVPQRHATGTGGAAADAAGIGHGDAGAEVIGGLGPPTLTGVATHAPGDGRHEGRPEPARLVWRPDAALGRDAHVEWGDYGPAIDRWTAVIGRTAPAPRLPTGRDGADQLNPAFVEWLMGLPAGHVTAVPGLTRNQHLRALGNGVVPQQGTAALTHLLDRMEAP